jgi:hypothetical protein
MINTLKTLKKEKQIDFFFNQLLLPSAQSNVIKGINEYN